MQMTEREWVEAQNEDEEEKKDKEEEGSTDKKLREAERMKV